MVAVDLSEFLLSARKIARSFAGSCTKPCIESSACVLAAMGDGGLGFLRRKQAAGLEGWRAGDGWAPGAG